MSFLVVTRTAFSVSLEAPSAARAFTARTLGLWGLDELADECPLLVSEVVTNAVLAGTKSITFFMSLDDDLFVEVQVQDDAANIPAKRTPAVADESGRGLMIVESLASDWGVYASEAGKVVWFRMTVKAEAIAHLLVPGPATAGEAAALEVALFELRYPQRSVSTTSTAPAR